MNKLAKRLILSFTVGICLMLFILIAVLTTIYGELALDRVVSTWFNKISNKGFIGFLKIFTYIGSIYTLSIISLSTLFFKKKAIGITACLMLLFSSLLGVVIKYIIRRPRPAITHLEEIGYSFPSAHAMLTFVTLGFIIYIVVKLIKNKALKIVLSSILAIIILMVGLSRVFLGVHYFTDVLAGWLIAIPILIAFILICNHLLKNPIKINKRLM